MRLFLIDTFATLVFFTLVATLTELLIVGMEPHQVLITRAIMMPMMVLTGRPYGAWRDWIFAKSAPRTKTARIVVDTAAFLSFQMPVYIVTLLIAGATLSEIVTSVGSATAFMFLLSRPFGLFLETCRRLAGVPSRATPLP